MIEIPDPDEPRRFLGLVREDRKPTVDLHRVRRHELGRNTLGDRTRNSALSRSPSGRRSRSPEGRPGLGSVRRRSGHPNPPPAFDRSREKRACGARIVSRVCQPVSTQPRARSRCLGASSTSRLRSERRPARPGEAVPLKLTVVFRRVLPLRMDGSVRLGPSTRTSSTRPIRLVFRLAATRWTTSTSRSIRSPFDLLRHLVGHRGGLGPWRGTEDEREGAFESDLLDHFERSRRSPARSRPGIRR